MSASPPAQWAAACLDALNKHTTEPDCFPVLGFRVQGTAFQTFLPLTFEISIVSSKSQNVAVLLVCVFMVAVFPGYPQGSTASMLASVRFILVSIQQLISNLSPIFAVLTHPLSGPSHLFNNHFTASRSLLCLFWVYF